MSARFVTWSLATLCITMWAFVVPMRAFADDPPEPVQAVNEACPGATDSASVLVTLLGARGGPFLEWAGTEDAQDGTDPGEGWGLFAAVGDAYWSIQNCVTTRAGALLAHDDADKLRAQLVALREDVAALQAQQHTDSGAVVEAVESLDLPSGSGGGSGEAVEAVAVIRQDLWWIVGFALSGAVFVGFYKVVKP